MVVEKKRQVVVTGGAGFIGSHLCEHLVNTGKFNVTSIDNYFTGKAENHVKEVNYLRGDSCDISELITDTPDYLFHFGEYSRVEQSFKDVNRTLSYNFGPMKNILDFCTQHNCKLIYSGSSTKFGDNGENRNASPYAWTKATNTELITHYARWFGLDYSIVYFYNVFGGKEIARGEYATVVAKFLELQSLGLPLPVVLPGSQKRNFTHIDDIVDGICKAAFFGKGDGYCIGSDQSLSIIELAQLISDNITYLPERNGNRMGATVDNRKLKNLGWKCRYNVRDYVHSQINAQELLKK